MIDVHKLDVVCVWFGGRGNWFWKNSWFWLKVSLM